VLKESDCWSKKRLSASSEQSLAHYHLLAETAETRSHTYVSYAARGVTGKRSQRGS
jgi:heat shock protein HspQ